MIKQILRKIRFDKSADRLGPDCPFTHWKLYYKSKMISLCKQKFAYFGENAEFRAGAYAITCSRISLGDNVVIRPSTMIFADPRDGENGSVTIEDDVMLGSGVHIYVANHRFDDTSKSILKQGHYKAEPVKLEKGCWIGANSIVLPGVTVGRNSVIGAGSVVTKNIPANSVAVGNPAKVVRTL